MSLPGDLGSSLKVTIENDSVKRNDMQEMRKNNKNSSLKACSNICLLKMRHLNNL